MNSISRLYALTSVTLRGTVMLIPTTDFESKVYPFDLNIILPTFLFAKKNIEPFLKFLHFINFHYSAKLTVSSLIEIDANPLLDELYKYYLRLWQENERLTVVPERRRLVEHKIIEWASELPKTPLSEYIKQYYSISIKNTDWQRKISLWKSLRHKKVKKKEPSAKKLKKLREKYVEVWFKFVDKIDFSQNIHSSFPDFNQSMNHLTFKDIIEETRFCPACEIDLGDYPSDINYCPQCGYELLEIKIHYCANCGAELGEGVHFCAKCGEPIERNY